TAQRIRFAIALLPVQIFVHLVGGDYDRGAVLIELAQRVEQMNGAHHIRGECTGGVLVRSKDQRLRSKVETGPRPGCANPPIKRLSVADIADAAIELCAQTELLE